jgi:hypothetical protein
LRQDLPTWRRIRRYAVPTRMIAEAMTARLAGDPLLRVQLPRAVDGVGHGGSGWASSAGPTCPTWSGSTCPATSGMPAGRTNCVPVDRQGTTDVRLFSSL